MITRHFLKTLLIFTTLIALGLMGVFILGILGNEDNKLKVDNESSMPRERILAE